MKLGYLIILVLSGVLAVHCSAETNPEPGIVDYLLQDVCVSPTGGATKEDPYRCPRHRDIRIGEAVPYLLTDYDQNTGESFQATSSIPVRGIDGRTMVLLLKLLQGSFKPNQAFIFSPTRDAYDLVDLTNSAYASIVRTFDGGCLDQLFSRNGKHATLADRAGGWVLFPMKPVPSAWPSSQSLRLTTWRIELSPKGGVCSDNHAAGLTSWSRPKEVTFETGKVLTAIRTDHFAAADLSAAENSFERFYFTRKYGLTRWEAWQTLSHCRKSTRRGDPECFPTSSANAWRTRCSILKEASTGLAGIANIGGQIWVRVACRDQTRYLPLDRPQHLLSPVIGRDNGVVDIAGSA